MTAHITVTTDWKKDKTTEALFYAALLHLMRNHNCTSMSGTSTTSHITFLIEDEAVFTPHAWEASLAELAQLFPSMTSTYTVGDLQLEVTASQLAKLTLF